MTIHEIRPKQLQALLLLLVLVPFIPLVLMLRFMADALEGEMDAARERFASAAQHTLATATAAEEKRFTAHPVSVQAEELLPVFHELFDRTVDVSIRDAGGRLAAGPPRPAGRLVAESTIHLPDTRWSVQAWLVDESVLKAQVRDQFKAYAWTTLISAIVICAIAATAGLTVNQQLRLHELKNSTVATVAHELRTPLATMRVLVDTLREGRCRSQEQVREYLDLLHSENLRLSRLTEHFLTHSRLQHGQHSFAFAPVAVETVVHPALLALRPKLDAPGCHFTLDLPKPLPELMADRDSLVTVLVNLLDNALKYSGDDKHITLRARHDRGAVVIVVQDNGVGLTTAERNRVFEPFFQVDQKLSRSREGCGLGLSIVRAIVNAHRGRVEIQSEPGQGATFAVHIPLAPA
jgi:signal transduction histidine kinase